MSASPKAKHAPGSTAEAGGDDAGNGARRQVLFRDRNEDIRRSANGSSVDQPLELVCECEHGDCSARLSVSYHEYEAVRRFPTRFLLRVDHLSVDERIVDLTPGFAVVEKVGAAARTAILEDPRKAGADGDHP